MIPSAPSESKLTDKQRQALFKIQALIRREFHRGMLSIVYAGTDEKLHVQIVSTCNSDREQIDLARRTLQQVEMATQKIITTLSDSERRIVP